MNLKAFFNINFFKENIKKSKGLLAFLLGIIPIINIIILIILLTGNEGILVDFNTLSFITYAGIIFIPLSLSITLFSFIFKKKSVDFVMSKPINRRSIYFTNTLGGIFILLIFTLINTLIFGLFSLIFSNLTIPFALLLDYFVFWFISYVFIFIVTNLAIVISGNLITSFVVLMIIVFLVPYLNCLQYFSFDYHSNYNYITCTEDTCKPENYYCYGDTECEKHMLDNEYELEYTKIMDYNFIAPLMTGNNIEDYAGNSMENSTMYNTISLVKMLVLSVVYGAAGYFIFKRRKMENNETSFKNAFAHYLVKGITLFPVCFVTYAIIRSTDGIGWLISIAGIIGYSIIYDLITRKEIFKFSKSLIISLIFFLLYTGIYTLNFQILDSKEHTIKEFDSLIYEEVEITDQSLINEVIKATLNKTIEQTNYTLYLILTEGSNKYEVRLDIPESLMKKLDQKVKEKERTTIKNMNYNNISYIEYCNLSVPVTKEIKKIIKDNINKLDDFDIDYVANSEILYLYSYKNHKYEKVSIPVKLTEELYKEVIDYQNKDFIKYITTTKYDLYFSPHYYQEEIFTDEDIYVFDYVINSNLNAFIDYLQNDNEIDLTKESMNIQTYYNRSYNVTINDIEKFQKEFEQYKENVKENSEYQNLIKQYEEQGELYEY